MKELIEILKKTVVFLSKIDQKGTQQFCATGFLISVQNICHLLTAKHVVMDMKTNKLTDDEMLVFFNSRDPGIASRPIKNIKDKYKVDWIFHQNKEVDIAIIPFGLDPHHKDDVKVIADDLFLSPDNLFESCDIFFLSYQPGIKVQSKIIPIFRGGTISIINEDKTFYIDGFAFPGNSGSPVFLKPSPIRFDGKRISIGQDNKLGCKFIGIIGEYITYREVAISTQTGRTRVVFEENTGLSKVWSVTFIKEIMESDTFKQQLDRIRNINQKGDSKN